MITNFGKSLLVEDDDGNLVRCVPRQNLGLVVCGDTVVWQPADQGDGVVSALNELAMASRKTFHIREKSIPVSEPVHSACEILGLDPLSVANEGRFVAFAPASEKEKCLEILQSHPVSADAREIGTVVSTHPPLVTLETPIGVTRILPMPSGEQLPRIC